MSAREREVTAPVSLTRPGGRLNPGTIGWARHPLIETSGICREGTLTIDGTEHRVSPEDAWAVLDHGRGRWPYDITWNWGAGSGRSGDRVIGVQFGGRWTQGTGSTENAVYIDGTIHKISDELEWRHDLTDVMAPWRVTGEGVDATFTPFYNKVTRTNLGVVASSTDQCFGAWSGTFAPEAGEPVAFSQIEGWAEHVHNRW